MVFTTKEINLIIVTYFEQICEIGFSQNEQNDYNVFC